jgi:N-succinyl-L-ornithine transcarbamylase
MKQFISASDVPNMALLIKKALHYKANPLIDHKLGEGKRIGLIFLNPSLRTRMSTQLAAQNLGLEPIIFNVDKEGWALEFAEGAIMNGTTVEHIKDAAPILGSYFDILAIRTFPSLKDRAADYNELVIHQFIRYAKVPVISLESATRHPLQSLTDLITIEEVLASKIVQTQPKIVLTWAPHVKALPQCVANSFAEWITSWNKSNFVIAHPPEFELSEEFTGNATTTTNQEAALENADIVYVKNWSSFKEYGATANHLSNWMLTKKDLSITNNAQVMHCLPVRRNVELSDEVLDNANSLTTQQAANRVWAAQAVISEILTKHG